MNVSTPAAAIDALTELMADRRRMLVVTGAGISTESGIPDYRGPQGVWKTQTPVDYSRFVASHEDRVSYWRQKVATADVLRAARPGRVHLACVVLADAERLEAVVTQNVDGLHADAGLSASFLVEVHGTSREAGCLVCGRRTPIEPHLEQFAADGEPPRCEDCRGILKPATISFGQMLDPTTIAGAGLAAERCDLVIALGTTLSVNPAAEIPLVAARRGVPYAIVNRGPTDHDERPEVTLRCHGEVGEIFGGAVDRLLGRGGHDDQPGRH